MWRRLVQCEILFVLVINIAVITCQEEEEDQSPDYSTIFQQFLLQKIREGESWEDFDKDSHLTRARQDILDVGNETDVQIIEDDINDFDVVDDDEAESVPEEVILNTETYRLSSSELTARIDLQETNDSRLLNLVCDVTSVSEDLLLNDACVPEVYLVADQNNCNNLPQVNTALNNHKYV